MKVIQTQPVEIALRTLDEEDRRKIEPWFERLKNWEKDPSVRERSQKLASTDGVYVLRTNSEYRIFFKLEQDRILILDIATKSTIQKFG
jgi:mRNA-degrading endonuclease RelE of RelBE toxin-antitoxin system